MENASTLSNGVRIVGSSSCLPEESNAQKMSSTPSDETNAPVPDRLRIKLALDAYEFEEFERAGPWENRFAECLMQRFKSWSAGYPGVSLAWENPTTVSIRSSSMVTHDMLSLVRSISREMDRIGANEVSAERGAPRRKRPSLRYLVELDWRRDETPSATDRAMDGLSMPGADLFAIDLSVAMGLDREERAKLTVGSMFFDRSGVAIADVASGIDVRKTLRSFLFDVFRHDGST